MLHSRSAATDLDLISFLRSIPDARMRRGVRFPAWYLLLVAVLGILSGCQSLRDLERFAIRHHSVLTEALGLELRRPPSDSSFRYFFQQVDVSVLCTAIRDWTIAQIPGGAFYANANGVGWSRLRPVTRSRRGRSVLRLTQLTSVPVRMSSIQAAGP